MKVVESADWRSSIPFGTPVLVADLIPGEPTRCATCATDADPFDRSELWAYKHEHPNNHSGYVRFYCKSHVPAVAAPVTAAVRPQRSAPRRESTSRPAPRLTSADADPSRALCPNCFVEASATGLCGMCGTQVV
ncbi:glucose-6-phosphate dehydrogenase [Microbacterium sp.]|uniref:glucose-6-phosphate dehydrogenase n=1 Tax=Microbacterium sp. TaxID=51671 RepID=UPI003F6F6C1D